MGASPWPKPPDGALPTQGPVALWLDGGLPGALALAWLRAWGFQALGLLPEALPAPQREAALAQLAWPELGGPWPMRGVAIAGPPHEAVGWGPAWAVAKGAGAQALLLPTWRPDAREQGLPAPPDWALGPRGGHLAAWKAHAEALAVAGQPAAWRPWASWGPAELARLAAALGWGPQGPWLWCPDGAQACGACGPCRAGRRVARAAAWVG